MDELIKSCLHEIAFDGDYGCDASRLTSFIEKFYTTPGKPPQNVDPAFRALVWSFIAQHPSVRVGFRPPEVKQDVYIADNVDQARGKRLTRQRWVNTGNQLSHMAGTALPSLQCLPKEEIETSTLEELVEKHGRDLRIAVDPEMCFQAVTRSSMTTAKLSSMGYTVLQLVAREREKGMTFVQLAGITGYSAGSIFYLVQLLQQMGMVKKLATVTTTGTQMAVHMHFWENHPHWQSLRAEEARAEEHIDELTGAPKGESSGSGAAVEAVDISLTPAEKQADEDWHRLEFEPMDSRHLTRPDIVLARVIKLLEHSKNNCHKQFDMLLRIGLLHPKKGERRRFSKIMNAAVEQGILERLFVPSKHRNASSGPTMVRVLRLVPGKGQSPAFRFGEAEETAGDAEANADADEKEVEEAGKAALVGTRCVAGISLQRNLVDVVHASGAEGITHAGILRELGHFEQRTVENNLQRLSKKNTMLPHLSDLGIILLTENLGRERRLRAFTTRNFRLLLEKEGLEDPNQDNLREDPEFSGGFMQRKSSDFYKDDEDLESFITNYQAKSIVADNYAAAKGRQPGSRTYRLGHGKPKIYKNPILPNGQVKTGRPRKYPPGENAASMKQKRKREEWEAAVAAAEADGRTPPPEPKWRTFKKKKTYVPISEWEAAVAAAEKEGRTPPPEPRWRQLYKASYVPAGQKGPAGRAEALDPPRRKRGPKPKNADDSYLPARRTTLDPVGTTPALGREGLVGGVLAAPTRPWNRKRKAVDSEGSAAPEKRAKTVEDTPAEEPMAPIPSEVAPDVAWEPMLLDDAVEDQSSLPEGGARALHVVGPADYNEPGQGASIEQATSQVDSGSLVTRKSRRGQWDPTPRMNISRSRRAQDVIEVLRRNGGVLHAGMPLVKAHHDYLRELEASGARPPGTATQIDKRTVQSVIEMLVHEKELKVLTTDSGAYGQHNRALYLLYLPDTPVEVVARYRRSLEKQLSIYFLRPKRPEDFTHYSEVSRTEKRLIRTARAEQEESIEEEGPTIGGLSLLEIRHHVLQREPRTVAQLYGYIPGLYWRARELHLYSLHDITSSQEPLAGVISASQRIVDTQYFFSGLPVGTWCSIVPVIKYHAMLEAYLHTTDGRDVRLRDAPVRIQRMCVYKSTRARAKLHQLLQVLTLLRIIEPLSPATGDDGHLACEPNGEYPSAFRKRKLGEVADFPEYWRFLDEVPVYNYLEDPAPFIEVVGTDTVEGSVQLWNMLQAISRGNPPGLISAPVAQLESGMFELSLPIGSMFSGSFDQLRFWKKTYRLSGYQQSCLEMMADDVMTPNTLQIGFPAEWLREVSYSLAAPQDTVENYLERIRQNRLDRLNEKRLDEERHLRAAKLMDPTQGARFLAAKLRESKAALEKSWQALVNQTIETLPPASYDLNAPDLLFIKKSWHLRHGRMNIDITRDRIISAITGTAMPAIRRLERRFHQPNRPGQALDVPHCSLCEKHMKGIQRLIVYLQETRKAPPLDDDSTGTARPKRRSRFTWTPELDELALDGEIVIRARCGPDQKAAIPLFTRIIPHVSTNNVRNHLARLHEERPGDAEYTAQLQAAWNALRSQPNADVADPLPDSLAHFPLERHIAYLRAHLDKSKLGGIRAEDFVPPEDDMVFDLPDDTSYIGQHWDVNLATGHDWDFLWKGSLNENRERIVYHDSFELSSTGASSLTNDDDVRLEHLAEAAVKMTLTPSEEQYDGPRAAEMLTLLGREHVERAFSSLKQEGVIRAIATRRPPSGRLMAISDAQYADLDAPLDWKLYRDAALLERDAIQMESEPWPLMASDGRTAGLLELISEGQVELSIDTRPCASLDIDIGTSSRVITDEDLENNIYLAAKDDDLILRSFDLGSGSPSTSARADVPEHTGEGIKCSSKTGSVTNCPHCITNALDHFIATLEEEQRGQLEKLLALLTEAGAHGISVTDLQAWCDSTGANLVQARQLLADMARLEIPIAACVGYDSGRAVSTVFLREWCLQTRKAPFDMVQPRRWSQPNGSRDKELWHLSLRSVMGWIVTRSGISEATLRERTATLFDRLEANDLLQALSDEGYAIRKTAVDDITPSLIGFSTPEEEAVWNWHIGPIPWYRLR